MAEKAAKFAEFEPKQLKSFGVASLLEENSKVYYDSVFSARHIGRVSDLLSAKLKGIHPNELQFRLLILYSLYESYCVQLKAANKNPGESLADPLTLECGVDSQKMAIGVSFIVEAKQPLSLESTVENVRAKKITNPLERMLVELSTDSDHLVLRVHEEMRRVEIVAFVSLIPLESSTEKIISFQAIRIDSAEKTESSSAEYIELGDLDYHLLLQEDGSKLKLSTPATGEILAQGDTELADDEVTRISGVTQTMDASSQVVKGVAETVSPKQAELYRTRIDQLQNRIVELEREAARAVRVVPGKTGEEQAPLDVGTNGKKRGIKEILEKVWPFKKKEEDAMAEAAKAAHAAAVTVAIENTAPPVLQMEAAATQEKPDEAKDADTSANADAKKLITDEVTVLEKTIAKVQQECNNLKNELGNPKAKKWIEGMVGEMMSEKARINEMGRKIGMSIRQNELEFRTKEMQLQEEIRKRDDVIRQRTHAFNRAKEQISQMTVQLERAKSGVANPAEENQMRQKYLMSQKLLAASKEEKQGLVKKVEELKDQLVAINNVAKEKKSTEDFAVLKAKYDKLSKQTEEFKRANQSLLEKLSEATRPKPAALNPEDLKRRLDVSMKLAASYQKDSEKLKLKVEELSREETRLKGELNRTLVALKSLKKPTVPSDSGSGGNQAA
jgi:hypothetical protein